MNKFLLFICLLMVAGCSTQKPPATNLAEPGAPSSLANDPNAVRLQLKRMQPGTDYLGDWQATYTGPTGTSAFLISFLPATGSDGISFGKGVLTAIPNANGKPLLEAVAKAMEAKHPSLHAKHVATFKFTYASLGDHMSLSKGGGFSAKPPGDWTPIKLFFGDGDIEVYFNLDPKTGEAEFAEKDSDYGDGVLRSLSSLF